MRKINSDYEILKECILPKDKIIIDVGCGTGELVRWMTSQGITAIGIDVKEMVEKAIGYSKIKNEEYFIGTGEQLPLNNNFANTITFIASFHHIPFDLMNQSLEECRRVLKSNGRVIIVEPIAKENSYYEIIKLVEDEAEIQNFAYKILKKSNELNYRSVREEIFYLERSFQDYISLLNIFIDSESKKKAIIEKAKIKTQNLCEIAGINFDDFKYKSIARLLILEKQ